MKPTAAANENSDMQYFLHQSSFFPITGSGVQYYNKRYENECIV